MEGNLLCLPLFLLVPFQSPDGNLRCLFGRGRTGGRGLELGARRDRPWTRCRRWLFGAVELCFGGRLNWRLDTHQLRTFATRFLIKALWNHAGRGTARARRQEKPKPYSVEESRSLPEIAPQRRPPS